MAAQVTTGLEIITHLDEDWAMPCQHRKHEGDSPADWIAWSVQCCPRVRPCRLWCTPCLDGTLQRLASQPRVCPGCGHIFAPGITLIRLIEPLNRKAI